MMIGGSFAIVNGYLKVSILSPILFDLSSLSALEKSDAAIGMRVLFFYLYPLYVYLNFSGYCDVMIGLGRAVGETMIVLMATGNTAIMDWNVFNGFRTLAANIATEMGEAPEGGTHYRVLFLAAFALFAITFVLNTVAEVVRQRFRKRAFQL